MDLEFWLRLIGMIIFAIVGWQIGGFVEQQFDIVGVFQLQYKIVAAAVGAMFGLILTPYFTTRPAVLASRRIRQAPAQHIVAGTIGLVVGLILTALLAIPLSLLPSPFGGLLSILAGVGFGYLGIITLIMREREILNFLGARFRGKELPAAGSVADHYVLLDTSVIIDGRIADISQTGFLDGPILVPRFVLNEIQHIADSPDTLRRNRGRRGLDMLNKLQKESAVPVQITDMDDENIHEVDGKLIALATQLKCPIVTNDYNLNRVAELQGLKVLNVNELANAVRTVVLPGETIKVKIIQEGKELGQGVGYLDDGTMVVVENGRKLMNSTVEVAVTRVLQTVAGRMIFATPDLKGSKP
jgi:uncharacterized protein YacL